MLLLCWLIYALQPFVLLMKRLHATSISILSKTKEAAAAATTADMIKMMRLLPIWILWVRLIMHFNLMVGKDEEWAVKEMNENEVGVLLSLAAYHQLWSDLFLMCIIFSFHIWLLKRPLMQQYKLYVHHCCTSKCRYNVQQHYLHCCVTFDGNNTIKIWKLARVPCKRS